MTASPPEPLPARTGQHHRWLLVVAVLALLLFCLAFQGLRGLWEPDEGRYTAVAVQMLRTGDWMHPMLHPEVPLWTKPPLTYWAVAASLRVFGRNAFAARLPNALALFATVLLVAGLGRTFTPRRPWLPALVYATFLLPAGASNFITTDTLLTFWEVLAVAAFARAAWGGDRPGRTGWLLLMWAAFGFGFFTKGPVALLPALAILVHRALLPKADRMNLRGGLGMVLVLVLGCWWYVAIVAGNLALGGYFLWDEVALRIFSGHHHRNEAWWGAPAIYGPTVILGTLPWTWPFLKGLVRAAARTGWFSRVRLVERPDRQGAFLALWFLVPLAVFLLARSRLTLYLLPLFAPAALLAARELEDVVFTPRRVRLLAGWVVLLLAVRAGAAFYPAAADSRGFARSLDDLRPERYREIVFVDTRPYHGLLLYLPAEVERVSLRGNDASLEDELEETDEEPRLWVVPDRHEEAFVHRAAEVGYPVRRLREAKGFEPVALYEGPGPD